MWGAGGQVLPAEAKSLAAQLSELVVRSCANVGAAPMYWVCFRRVAALPYLARHIFKVCTPACSPGVPGMAEFLKQQIAVPFSMFCRAISKLPALSQETPAQAIQPTLAEATGSYYEYSAFL